MTQVSSDTPEQSAILPRPALRDADGQIIHAPPVLVRLPDLVEPTPEEESTGVDDRSSSTDDSRRRRRRRSRKKRRRDRTEELAVEESAETEPVIRPAADKKSKDIPYTAIVVAAAVGAIAGFVYVFFGNDGQEQDTPAGSHAPWYVAEDIPNVGPLNLHLGQQSTVGHDQGDQVDVVRSEAQAPGEVGDAVTDSGDDTELVGVGLHDEPAARADFAAQHNAVEEPHGPPHVSSDGYTAAVQTELSAAAPYESTTTEQDRTDLQTTVSVGGRAASQEQFVPWRPGVPTTTAEAAAQLPVARMDDIDWPADYEQNSPPGLRSDTGNSNVVEGNWNSLEQSSGAPHTPSAGPSFPVSNPTTWYYANPAVARRQPRTDTSYVPSTPSTGPLSTPYSTQPGAAQLQGIIQPPAN